MAIADITAGVKRDLHLTNGLRPVHEAAAYLGVSRSKVYCLMEEGLLPYVKLGKTRRIRWSDLEKMVAENTIGSVR